LRKEIDIFSSFFSIPFFHAFKKITCHNNSFLLSYLRDMLYQNKEITQYFNDETMHVLDYDFEYLPGYLDAAKFPEYTNKVEEFKPINSLKIFV